MGVEYIEITTKIRGNNEKERTKKQQKEHQKQERKR